MLRLGYADVKVSMRVDVFKYTEQRYSAPEESSALART
jgi:hypothetical protein